MSLCVAIYSKYLTIVAADSRVSFSDSEGNILWVNDNCQKIRPFGDKMIFITGTLSFLTNLFDNLSDNDSIKDVQQKAISNAKKENPSQDLGVYVFTMENEQWIMYQIYRSDKLEANFEINRGVIEVKEGKHYLSSVAAHSEEAVPYIVELFNQGYIDIEDVLLKTYEHFADEMVGGYLYLYFIMPGTIKKYDVYKIKDKRELKKYDYLNYLDSLHATSNGVLTATGANVQGTINCDELMVMGSSILDITKSYIDGQYLANNSISNEKIDSISADKITAGTIRGITISGGTIASDTTINVGTDVNIGANLYMNPNVWGSRIYLNDNASIYGDPMAHSILLDAPGGVWAGTQRLDQPQVAKFG